jgi:hypothetical protein
MKHLIKMQNYQSTKNKFVVDGEGTKRQKFNPKSQTLREEPRWKYEGWKKRTENNNASENKPAHLKTEEIYR